MKKSGIPALLLALLLLAGCGQKTKKTEVPAPAAEMTQAPAPAQTATEETAAEPELSAAKEAPVPEAEPVALSVPDPAEKKAPAAPEKSLLSFTEDEGPEEGAELTYWSYNGSDAAEFITILLPVQEGFPLSIGTMLEGPDAALLSGVVRGDRESGTAELVLAAKDGSTETVLTLMYSRDRVSLMELDADMGSFCRRDEATGLYTVAFTDDSALSFENAGLLLEGLTEKYTLAPAFTSYGLDPAGLLDLRVPPKDR